MGLFGRKSEKQSGYKWLSALCGPTWGAWDSDVLPTLDRPGAGLVEAREEGLHAFAVEGESLDATWGTVDSFGAANPQSLVINGKPGYMISLKPQSLEERSAWIALLTQRGIGPFGG